MCADGHTASQSSTRAHGICGEVRLAILDVRILTGGAQDTSPPTWFASKSRSPMETAETLFEMSVSAKAAGVVCSASVDFVHTPM